MRTSRFLVAAASTLVLSASGVYGQSIISAHSGVLHYYEGDVTIDGQTPHQKTGTFAEVKDNQELQTQVGRAEVLLTPGVFLRLGENSGIRMVSNKLEDTQIAFLNGSVIADFVDILKGNSVKVSYQDYQVTFLKKGIYRFDSQPAQFRVYSGEAQVSRGGSTIRLKDGRALPFTPALISEKFDNHTGDSLYRWAKRRSEYIAVANLSAARRAGSSYNSSSGTGYWYYNPYYSMYTFLPGRGILCDPFAMYACYYSPYSAWEFYNPNYYNYGRGGGYSGGGYNSAGYYPTSIGTSSTMSTYGGYPAYSAAPSVSTGTYSGSNAASSPGFSGGATSSVGGGASAGGAAGGGGGASHGGGSAGGRGR